MVSIKRKKFPQAGFTGQTICWILVEEKYESGLYKTGNGFYSQESCFN